VISEVRHGGRGKGRPSLRVQAYTYRQTKKKNKRSRPSPRRPCCAVRARALDTPGRAAHASGPSPAASPNKIYVRRCVDNDDRALSSREVRPASTNWSPRHSAIALPPPQHDHATRSPQHERAVPPPQHDSMPPPQHDIMPPRHVTAKRHSHRHTRPRETTLGVWLRAFGQALGSMVKPWGPWSPSIPPPPRSRRECSSGW